MDDESPAASNLFCALDTMLAKESVAGLYEQRGWSVRRCSWSDYEVRCDWAELVIDGDSPILMHGPVTDVVKRVKEILEPLHAAGISFTAECYDADGTLLEVIRSTDR